MIEIFQEAKRKYKQFGDKYFIDKSILTEGIYIRINKDLSITEDDILIVKSKKVEEHPFELYEWFRQRDFYSKILYDDANKCIDTNEKKIHSINPFSLILKRQSLPDVVDYLSIPTAKKISINGLSTEEIFDIIVGIHFGKMEELYKGDIDYKQYSDILSLKSREVTDLFKGQELKPETRFKIFIDEDLSLYEQFFMEYIKHKSFLDKAYNVEVEGEGLLGVSAYNNTLNEDKRTLLMRTTAFKAPYRITTEDSAIYYKMSLIIKDIVKELKEQGSGTILEVNGKGEVENYEFVVKSDKPIPYKEFSILTVENPKDILINGVETGKNRQQIEADFNQTFLKGLLYEMYNIESGSDITKLMKGFTKKFTDTSILNELIMGRSSLKSYFKKNQSIDITHSVLKITDCIFDYEVKNTNFSYSNSRESLKRLWDKQTSLIYHLSKGRIFKNMAEKIQDTYAEIIKEFAQEGFIETSNDATFYFMAGQVSKYLISHSRAKDKSARLLTPFLQAKNVKEIKDLIDEAYEMYAYALPLYSEANVNRAVQAILTYAPKEDLKNIENKHVYKAGLIGTNVFFMKKENKDNYEVDNQEENEE